MEYTVMVCDNCEKEAKGAALDKRYYLQVVDLQGSRFYSGMKVVRLDLCEECGDKLLGEAIKKRIAKEGF